MIESDARRTRLTFFHDGTVKSRWFWWVVLPALDAIIAAMLYTEASHVGFVTDVAMLVMAREIPFDEIGCVVLRRSVIDRTEITLETTLIEVFKDRGGKGEGAAVALFPGWGEHMHPDMAELLAQLARAKKCPVHRRPDLSISA